jgi:hypothetical protein
VWTIAPVFSPRAIARASSQLARRSSARLGFLLGLLTFFAIAPRTPLRTARILSCPVRSGRPFRSSRKWPSEEWERLRCRNNKSRARRRACRCRPGRRVAYRSYKRAADTQFAQSAGAGDQIATRRFIGNQIDVGVLFGFGKPLVGRPLVASEFGHRYGTPAHDGEYPIGVQGSRGAPVIPGRA